MCKGLIVAAALLCAGIGAAEAAPAGAPGAALLARALDAHTTALQRERYALAAGPLQGNAAPGRPGRASVRLWANQDYVFAAACVSACGPLQLRVVDPSGAVIASAAGRAPVVRVRPEVTGRHALEAAAPSCAADACWYAVNVYAR